MHRFRCEIAAFFLDLAGFFSAMAGCMAILGASVDGLVMSPGRVVSRAAQPALSLSMLAPKGPFGGSTEDGEGWVGDRGVSAQVTKFEAGSDYLFFQGPAPTSAVQPDLPGLLTGVRTGHPTRRLCHIHMNMHMHMHMPCCSRPTRTRTLTRP